MCFTDSAGILVRFSPFRVMPPLKVWRTEPCEDHTIVVETKPDAGISISAAALRERLDKIKAQYERDSAELKMAIRTLEGTGYLHLEKHETFWQFLKDHPGQHHIHTVADQLVELGVELAGESFDAHHVAKITVGQPTFAHIFNYNKKTKMVSLTSWAAAVKVGTQPEGAPKRKRKRRSRPKR